MADPDGGLWERSNFKGVPEFLKRNRIWLAYGLTINKDQTIMNKCCCILLISRNTGWKEIYVMISYVNDGVIARRVTLLFLLQTDTHPEVLSMMSSKFGCSEDIAQHGREHKRGQMVGTSRTNST